MILALLSSLALSADLQAMPQLIREGVVSTADAHESVAGFDPHTGHLLFSRADADFVTSMVLSYPGTESGVISKLAFSKSQYDTGVSFSPDGEIVLFTSSRNSKNPDLSNDWNIFTAKAGAVEASALPSPVNSSSSECCAAFSPDGSFLFSSNRSGSWDIYRAQMGASEIYEVQRLKGSINSEHDEWPGQVSDDGRMILMSSIRPGGPGGDDVFIACLVSGKGDYWTVQRLGSPINSPAFEDNPRLSPDGTRLYWSSWRARESGEEMSNIYSIDLNDYSLPQCD